MYDPMVQVEPKRYRCDVCWDIGGDSAPVLTYEDFAKEPAKAFHVLLRLSHGMVLLEAGLGVDLCRADLKRQAEATHVLFSGVMLHRHEDGREVGIYDQVGSKMLDEELMKVFFRCDVCGDEMEDVLD